MQRHMAAGGAHLDTVRALHQTVVSLRTALELSKRELRDLKEKYERHSHCLHYADVIEKLTLENHVLRRTIIDSDFERKEPSTQNINLEVTYSPHSGNSCPGSEAVIQTATDAESHREPDVSSERDTLERGECHPDDNASPIETLEPWQPSDENSNFCSSEKLNEIPEVSETPELNVSAELSPIDSPKQSEQEEKSQIVSVSKQDSHLPSFKTHLELLSKFDVRIKVRTLKDSLATSSGTSDSDSTFEEKRDRKTNIGKTFEFEESQKHFDRKDNLKSNKVNVKSVSTEIVKMAVPNEGDVTNKPDKFDVQVRITSEESLVLEDNAGHTHRRDTLNLDVDDLSLRSLSEGDNSVFSGSGTPAECPSLAERPSQAERPAAEERPGDASGNESEEVDDIELIFTTDESKDMTMNLQEELVSYREGEVWAGGSARAWGSAQSTPVLVKFHTLDPDFQPGNNLQENQENTETIPECALKVKRVSLPSDKEVRRTAFNGKESLGLPGRGILRSCDNKSDITLYNKSPHPSSRRLDSVDSLTGEYNRGLSLDNTSSLELGSSMDILHRDESLDTSRLGHRFSVFAERDISKCGTSEEELAATLSLRRNTCPNPFQYRVPYRGVSRGGGRAASRARPGGLARREHGVQTDVSALPDRWSSDGHLAHKFALAAAARPPTLPERAARRGAGGAATRTGDTRRVLLSDIGFTSMVPELSRSAEPVWARTHLDEDTLSNNTAKYLARGSPSLRWERGWCGGARGWRSSLPDVRRDDTEQLLEEAETFVRRSIADLHEPSGGGAYCAAGGQPYIPAGPRQLRLGHAVKVITPQGRIAVGRVRYVGLAGGTAACSGVVVGCEVGRAAYPALPPNDGTHRGRRYFLTPPTHTALFVPFNKVVMAWAH